MRHVSHKVKAKSEEDNRERSCSRGTQYAVLGLGDQNYSAFMAVPRMFSTIMEKGGATMYKKRLEADDTLGLYEQVDAWVDTLWVDLDQAIGQSKISQRKSEKFSEQ